MLRPIDRLIEIKSGREPDTNGGVIVPTVECRWLLLSGAKSSAGRPMPDGERPKPGGWNRIHLVVGDLPAEVARLRAAGVKFRNDIVTGPGGSQILLMDPAGNLVELFQAS